MAITRVLTVDGGGVRGIIPAIVLERLCAEPGLDGWLDRVDLVAGTSTGGLIALSLAAGIAPGDLRALYEKHAGEVFADNLFDDVKDLGKLIGADYNVGNLERVVHETLGDKTLAQLDKRVLVTAFDLDNEDPDERTWKPKLFHNYPGPDSDGDALAYRVGTATAAAPTYFESFDGYIDGGVFATNPSMCALDPDPGPAHPGRRARRAARGASALTRDRPLAAAHRGPDARLGLRAVGPPAHQPHARRRQRHRRLPVQAAARRPLPPARSNLPDREADRHGRRRRGPVPRELRHRAQTHRDRRLAPANW